MNKFLKKSQALLEASKKKVTEILNDPRTDQITRTAAGALELAGQLASAKLAITSPLGMAAAGLSMVSKLKAEFYVEPPDPVDLFFEKLLDGVAFGSWGRRKQSKIPVVLEAAGAFSKLDMKRVVESSAYDLYQVTDASGKMAFFRKFHDGSEPSSPNKNNKRKVRPDVMWDSLVEIQNGFDFSFLSILVWQGLGSKELKFAPGDSSSDGSAWLSVQVMPDDELKHVIELEGGEITQLTESIKKYHARGVSRAYVLYGVPGTGKTTRVRAYARANDLRLLLVTADALQKNIQDLENWIDLLLPDIILFDDVDRSAGVLETALNLFEDLRRKHPKVVQIATVNNLEELDPALLRPGRLGKKILFDIPNETQKLKLLINYMGAYGVSVEGYNLPELVKTMTHPDFSHDYVRFVAEEMVVHSTQEDMLEVIGGINQHLDFANQMDNDLFSSMVRKFRSSRRGGTTALSRVEQALSAAPLPVVLSSGHVADDPIDPSDGPMAKARK